MGLPCAEGCWDFILSVCLRLAVEEALCNKPQDEHVAGAGDLCCGPLSWASVALGMQI